MKEACSAELREKKQLTFSGLVLRDPTRDGVTEVLSYCLFLASRHASATGGALVHSAAVARGEDGFLFLGDSGAGKTTVVTLSAERGLVPLGDDLNFVLGEADGRRKLAASPSPNPSPLPYGQVRPQLRGILVLRQAASDSLHPLPPVRVAKLLFQGLMQTPPGFRLHPDDLTTAFRNCCRVADSVPGFELSFRRSPGFWDLLDAEFPPR